MEWPPSPPARIGGGGGKGHKVTKKLINYVEKLQKMIKVKIITLKDEQTDIISLKS